MARNRANGIDALFFLICSTLVLAGCGGGSSSGGGTSTGTNPPPPTGSEYLYEFGAINEINVAQLNPSTGTLGPVSNAAPNLPFSTIQPEFGALGATPSGKFLYAVADTNTTTGFGFGIVGFSISNTNGELTNLAGSPFGGSAIGIPTGFLIDNQGENLYVSQLNASNGPNINVIQNFKIDPSSGDVSVGPLYTETANQYGQYDLQTIDPSGKYLIAYGLDLNGVEVYVYKIDSGTISPVAGSPFLAIANSNYVSFDFAQVLVSPSGNFLYVYFYGFVPNQPVQGATGQLYAFALNSTTGALGAVSGSPFYLAGASEVKLAMSPDGKFLYVPGGDPTDQSCMQSIATFAVDTTHGTIQTTPVSSVTGSYGCDNFIDPSGSILVSTNDDVVSDTTASTFTINGSTGTLSPVAGSPFNSGQEALGFISSVAVRTPQ